MRDLSQSNTTLLRPSRWAIYLVIGQLLLGGLPTVARLMNRQFLESPAWADQARLPAWGVGLAFALFVIWFLNDGFAKSGKEASAPTKVPAYVLFPLLWLSLGRIFVLESIPMVEAAFKGQETQLTLVFKYKGSSSKTCYRKLYVKDLPVFSNSICNIPEGFLKTLKPGAKIIVSGQGTPRGLFVDYVRPAA
jgi:hypothetical protein